MSHETISFTLSGQHMHSVTAYSDKHPAYEVVTGPSGDGLTGTRSSQSRDS